MTTVPDARTDWQRWHDEREATAIDPHGPAALIGTHWLDDQPLAVEATDSTWVDAEGVAVGTGSHGRIELAPGHQHRIGNLLLHAIVRAGKVALRVFDPDASTRTDLRGIDVFDHDPALVLTGTVDLGAGGLRLEHIDGFRSDNVGATVHLTIGTEAVALRGVVNPDGGVQITFADTTNGQETQRFRFLTLPAPDEEGRVTVDFNRAYLPPCTFSDHFLCPLPPQDNRLNVAIRAGESRLRRTDAR
ncbi:DUF1684 domain-containing protein [Nocardia callitridis]|uniref:DUF1684 domain-containing protein n=1 Tax=Nocardia callitridis TaxID=648753 RepID=A0ABP9K642_9NOCA